MEMQDEHNLEAPQTSTVPETESPPKPLQKGRAIWDYNAIEVILTIANTCSNLHCMTNQSNIQDNEISFAVGDIIEVLDLCNDDWYEGRAGDKVGYFPANRIELLKDSSEVEQVAGSLSMHIFRVVIMKHWIPNIQFSSTRESRDRRSC
jgi:hypothetical protein